MPHEITILQRKKAKITNIRNVSGKALSTKEFIKLKDDIGKNNLIIWFKQREIKDLNNKTLFTFNIRTTQTPTYELY